MLKLKLTDKELEVMAVLWDKKEPMTAAEIVERSKNRTWKEASIYTILNTLIKKRVAVVAEHKPTITNNARAYIPTMSSEEYIVSEIELLMKRGVEIDIDALAERILREANS